MKVRTLTLSMMLCSAAGLAITAGAAPPASRPVAAVAGTGGAPAMDDSSMSMQAGDGAMSAGAGMSASADARPAKPTNEQLDFFEAKVRPVLAANCYKCHSSAEKVKGGLLLDTREGWQKGGENGPVIAPGDPEKSVLIKAIRYTDVDLQMPPKGEKLKDAEVADLVTWVKMGAPDPRSSGGAKLTGLTDKARSHWAYQPVQNPPIPQVKDGGWLKTPVDAFVLAKLEASGLSPTHPATREALIRRASYDLIGLPPTPEQVKAFVDDASPDAYEKVIDRLLASPEYGERWGRFWLDSARYSDTSGIENNNRQPDYRYAHAWTYRDYVIKAFNDDKPYDQFLKEQLAADLLPSALKDRESLAALGFITVGKRFQNPNDQIDEHIDALGKAMLATSIACARCHDHKFDPIPTADYYSLHGVFNSIVEPAEKPLLGPTPAGPEYDDFKAKLAELEARNRDAYYDLIETKQREFRKAASGYLQLASLGRRGNAKEDLARNKLISDYRLDRDLQQSVRLGGGGFGGGPGFGGGRRGGAAETTAFLPLQRFSQIPADEFEKQAGVVLASIADGGDTGRSRINPLVVAAFKDVKPDQLKSFKDVTDIYAKLFSDLQDKQKMFMAANRLAKESASKGAAPKLIGFEDASLVELMNIPMRVHPAGDLDTEGLKTAIAELRLQNGGFQRFGGFAAVNELMLTHPGAPARAMVVADSPRPRNSPIFIRGEAQNRGPVVPRQFLEVLSGKDRKPFSGGSGRLDLADAIASKSNPLTARVAVNRIWAHHFGEGIVRTLDDMGTMCDPPSHPELLDYLATQFMNDGWSFKKMHKLIMLSSAYQQSSDTNLDYAQKDPENRLIWRGNLRRLDFEAVRDTMLMFTGKIDLTVGGKPVNLTDEPYSYRRSVYGYVDRGQMPELMQQFDFPDADMANSRRSSTIVPQQALFFMNSPMSADVARKVTSRPEFTDAKDDVARVKALYEVLFQRAPKSTEVSLARDFIDDAEGATPEVASAKALRGAANRQRPFGKGNRPGNQRAAIKNSGETVERRPLTAWEQYAQALLMTNEIVYVN